ncbi:hypothetical protein [Psychromicrobium xiongbiense]|uniref:hypothetical protein n=1 Tax=Psychromicrobium xiongbiense TaxID=3051184 RepID=UPI00255588E2|nr:hypothetical protein [Psychromicrobium sp. YIM S02556]
MRLWNRAPRLSSDQGIPELAHPEHVLIHPLQPEFLSDGLRLAQSRWQVEVEMIGGPRQPTWIRSRARPLSRFLGLVAGSPVPGLIDLDDPTTPYLVEPPYGYRIPIPDPATAALWVERDRRSRELRHRYPVPPLADLVKRFQGVAADPTDAAVRWRLSLLTAEEAAQILDRVRAEGEAWGLADARVAAATPMALKLGQQIHSCLSHLGELASTSPQIDTEPLFSMGMSIAQRSVIGSAQLDDLRRIADIDAYSTVIQPFLDICGPL